MIALRPDERELIERLQTPADVQAWLDSLAFNGDNIGKTIRSFRQVVQTGSAHCIEAALAAAFVLAPKGHAPILLDLWSDDKLDHVVLLWKGPEGWGTVGKSQYPGLQGRKAVYRSVRHLAWSYVDPYVDETGRLNGYATYDLRDLGKTRPWSLRDQNAWRVENALLANKPKPLRASDARHARWLRRYRGWKAAHPDLEPPASFYAGSERFVGELA